MKKIILFLIFVFIFLNVIMPEQTFAETERVFFAKVKSSGVQLCSAPTETAGIFELPNSYFVKVSYVVDDFYKVTYNDVEGYVKKDKVSLMNGTPKTPYANPNYTLFVPYALYETASSQAPIKAQLSAETTITYYGPKSGEQLSQDSKIWFFSSVEVEGEKQFGYVFSRAAYKNPALDITPNTETFEIVSDEMLLPSATTFTALSTGTKIMLIVAISVPSVLILYFLIKPSKIMQITKTRQKSKQETKRIRRHGDYFEFDESEL